MMDLKLLSKTWAALLMAMALSYSNSIHPGFDLVNLRPGEGDNEFKPVGIGGMDFMSDGRLVIVSWGGFKVSRGKVYILSGVDGSDSKNVKIQELVGGLREPMGLKVVNDEIYVVEKTRLIKITDADSNGVGEITTVYDGWGFDEKFEMRQGTWHAYGLLMLDSSWYITLSNDRVYWAGVLGQGAQDRGTLIKIPFDGKGPHENLLGGLRNPNGLALGPDGEIFSTDNQGQWLPSNKFVHLKEGRFYGFKMNPKTPFVKDTPVPPAAWVPQDEVGNSISEPVLVTDGVFKGQMLIGDVHKGGIKRYFLERIKGEYQACIFRFSESNLKNGIEAGVNRLKFGPDGALYVGGVGGGDAVGLGGWSDWNWNNTWTGLQKLVPNGKVPFEMLAVRSMEDGFEVEFTQPVGRSGQNRGAYNIESWGFAPSQHYGAGNKVGLRKMKVAAVELSDNRKKARLIIPGIQEGRLYHLKLNRVLSKEGETLWGDEAWYTLNWMGPADVMGCMQPEFVEYNPAAVYDFGKSCSAKMTAEEKDRRVELARKQATQFKVEKGRMGKLDIHVPFEQPFKLSVSKLEGPELDSATGAQPMVYSVKKSLQPGLYLIKVQVGDAVYSRRSIVF